MGRGGGKRCNTMTVLTTPRNCGGGCNHGGVWRGEAGRGGAGSGWQSGKGMFCQRLEQYVDTLIALLSRTARYFWGLLLAGDPRRRITSGSHPPSYSEQHRAATRNSCAKLASISLTFSPTVNPFLPSFSHCWFFFFFPLMVWSLLCLFFSFSSLTSGCHTV